MTARATAPAENPHPRRRGATTERAPTTHELAQLLARLAEDVDKLASGITTLTATIRSVDRNAATALGLLAAHLAALRALLVGKCLITADEALAVAQVAELEQMLLTNPAPGRRRRRPMRPERLA